MKKYFLTALIIMAFCAITSCFDEESSHPAVFDFRIDASTTTVSVGQTLQLTAVITTSTGAERTVSWESHDSGIASINQEGLVTGIAAGSTWIFAYTTDDNGERVMASLGITVTPSTLPWTKVAAGINHSIGIRSDGSLWTWGNNYSGQLGQGPSSDKNIPTPVTRSVLNLIVISGGNSHTVALASDGSLWAWGSNYYGQLGNDSDDFEVDVNFPERIGSDSWKSVSAGSYFTVGIKSDGTLWVWGDYTNPFSNSPVQIGTETDWNTVSAGFNHFLVIKNDGTLWSVGEYVFYDSYTGTAAFSYAPIQIGTEAGWYAISACDKNSVALKTDGTLWTWGLNESGETGDGTKTSRTVPYQIAGTWKQAEAGSDHCLAIKSDGTLWAWGDNSMGQLGTGSSTENIIPVQIGTSSDWSYIDASGDHSIAIKTDGSLYGWGDNDCGQIGDGSTTDRFEPVIIE